MTIPYERKSLKTSSLDDRPEKPMEHLKRMADEFGRQAETFEVWAEKTDDQVAAVVNYVRTHFDNPYTDTVTAADVARLRAAPTDEGNR